MGRLSEQLRQRRESKHTTWNWEQFQFTEAKEGNAATARRRRRVVVLRPHDGEVRAHKDCMQGRQGMSALMPQQTNQQAPARWCGERAGRRKMPSFASQA
jgi:hypothetical protein